MKSATVKDNQPNDLKIGDDDEADRLQKQLGSIQTSPIADS